MERGKRLLVEGIQFLLHPLTKQQPHHITTTYLSGFMQKRGAGVIFGVNIRPCFDEQEGALVAVKSMEKGRSPRVIAGVYILLHAMPEQKVQDLVIGALGRPMQRCSVIISVYICTGFYK